MATMIVDHRFTQVVDLKTSPRVTLKYCEWCRIQFVCDKDEARFPGDYISLQRGAGKRAPIICSRCENDPKRLSYMKEEAEEMEAAIRSVLAQGYRTTDIHRSPSEQQVSTTEMGNLVEEAITAAVIRRQAYHAV